MIIFIPDKIDKGKRRLSEHSHVDIPITVVKSFEHVITHYHKLPIFALVTVVSRMREI